MCFKLLVLVNCFSNVFALCASSDSIQYSITPPKPPVFDGTLTTDTPSASEEKGMSIPVIGSSECLFHSHSLILPHYCADLLASKFIQIKFTKTRLCSCFTRMTESSDDFSHNNNHFVLLVSLCRTRGIQTYGAPCRQLHPHIGEPRSWPAEWNGLQETPLPHSGGAGQEAERNREGQNPHSLNTQQADWIPKTHTQVGLYS